MTTGRIRDGAVELACHRSGGAGADVVLLHGNSCSARAFAHQLGGALGRRLALTALDLPGHGASPDAAEPAATYCMPGYAAAVVGAVQRLGLERAVFVGWSLGGHVLLEAADRLRAAAGFMLVAAPPLAELSDMARAFRPSAVAAMLFQRELDAGQETAFAEAVFGRTGGKVAELRADLRRADGRAREELGRSLQAGAYRDEVQIVRGLAQPLAVVIGEHDSLIDRAYFDRVPMPALWRGGVQVMRGAGHAPHWEKPAAFDALLNAFVADCAAMG